MAHPTDPDCIFCRIVAGDIPCHRLLDHDDVMVMLDIGPLSRGHMLVIPKGHYVTIAQVPPSVAAACGSVFPRLAKAIQEVTGTTASNVLQNNGRAAHQAVDHVHFHLIPKTPTGGLGIQWPAGELDAADALELAKDLRGHLA